MIITILILMLSMIGLCIVGYKSNMTIPVFTKISGLILILFSALEYIIKTSIYRTFLNWEWSLYFAFSGMKLGISGIIFINVVGMALYMSASAAMKNRVKTKSTPRLILMFIPIIALLVIEFPNIKEWMYLTMLGSGMSLAEVTAINDFKTAIECMTIILYITAPYYRMIKTCRTTCLYEVRRDACSAMAVWGVIDVSGMVTIFGGGIYRCLFLNLGWLGFANNVSHFSNETIMFFSSIACVIIVLFIIVRYMPVRSSHTGANVLMKEKDENIFSLLHTYKNAFCAIMMYADAKDGENEVLYNNKTRIEMVRDIAEEQCEKINSAMVMFKNETKGIHHVVDLNECAEQAIPKSKAQACVNRLDENVYIMADEYKIVECIVCMLNNSYEAVKNNEDGKTIELSVGKENGCCYIEIKDNGCGIKKKDLSKIFKPFYSTKKRADNYGLGLTYVRRVVLSYGGSITVKSKKDKFTVIQLVFEEAQKNEKNQSLGM